LKLYFFPQYGSLKAISLIIIFNVIIFYGISRINFHTSTFFSKTNIRKSLLYLYFIAQAISLYVLYNDSCIFTQKVYAIFYKLSVILCHFGKQKTINNLIIVIERYLYERFSISGFTINLLDIAPRYVTVLIGIANAAFFVSRNIAMYIIEQILTYKVT